MTNTENAFSQEVLPFQEYYATQSALSDPGKYSPLYGNLPNSIEEICKIVHGLVVHPSATKKIYNFEVPSNRKSEPNIHFIEDILAKMTELDGSPLTIARDPQKRVIGLCRDFALLATSILRHQGVPARVRVGFATYWHEDLRDDHWITEYWDRSKEKWIMFDAEVGSEEKKSYNINFDPTEISPDKFFNAGQAWKICRAGNDDPKKFGTTIPGINGWWFMRANLIRDLAALNKVELQPWDYTEFANKKFDNLSHLDSTELQLLDHIAELLATEGKQRFSEIRDLYESNPDLKVGTKITSYPGRNPEKTSLIR